MKYETIKEGSYLRIVALKNFNDVKKGDKGGSIEKLENLSQLDNSWIYENAIVYDDAKVYDDAIVYGYAMVYGNAEVYGDAEIYDSAEVYGNARVYGKSEICGNAEVRGNAIVCERHMIRSGVCKSDIFTNLRESIRCQTGIGVFNDKIIAYKQVRKNLMSFYDDKFIYKVGHVAEVNDAEISNNSCTTGLHFSNMNYWNKQDILNSTFLMAEIALEDVITVQSGKIRCKKALILAEYNI